jgi:electron transport complex protein RnfG
MKKLKNTENILVLGLFLGVCGAIAALVLAYFDDVTRDPIEKMKMLAVNNALKEALPAFDNSPGTNSFEKDGVVFYGAKKDGKLVAIAASGFSMKGYSGKIAAMVGLNLDGSIGNSCLRAQKPEDYFQCVQGSWRRRCSACC